MLYLVLSIFNFYSVLCNSDDEIIITDEFVSKVNQLAATWKADSNKGTVVYGATRLQAKALCGALKGGPVLPAKVQSKRLPRIRALPTDWNAAAQWPFCATMKVIRDQSACGSCWAFGAVEAMSDRTCIFLNKNMSLSAADMAFCCSSCGFGCGGGYPGSAWQYYQETGVVEEGCWPYPFPSCDHHIPHSKNPCPGQEYSNPPCPSQCSSSWKGPNWNNDLHYGKSAYSLSGVSAIMQELFQNGPVEATFEVYEDFLTYRSGVYQHTTGSYLGGHAVKMMGWGVDGNVPYWLIANSWNPNWGDHGYFKILRGQDECGIEDSISAGIPLS